MKNNFFSTRKVSILVIILVFTFGGACTPQESHVTYFENTIEEKSEESSDEIIIEDLGDNTKKIKTKKEKTELETNEMPEIEETIASEEQSAEDNEIIEAQEDDASNQSSEIEKSTEKTTEPEEEPVVVTEEKETSAPEKEATEESVLEENIIESAKANVTMADRAEATALAMKRLSAGELRSLIAMSRGGFTADEKKKALQMMHEKFSKEEQEWILSKFYEYVGGN